jgi:hypothetical protein
MRVPFFCRTLPMLLPAVPASVSATDSHISPPPAPIRSNPFVRRAKREWGPARFWRGGGAGASGGGDHEGERWPSRGRAALFSAARPCLQVPRLVASGSGRCPLLSPPRLSAAAAAVVGLDGRRWWAGGIVAAAGGSRVRDGTACLRREYILLAYSFPCSSAWANIFGL